MASFIPYDLLNTLSIFTQRRIPSPLSLATIAAEGVESATEWTWVVQSIMGATLRRRSKMFISRGIILPNRSIALPIQPQLEK